VASALHRPVAADSVRVAARHRTPAASRRAPCRAGRCGALPSPPRSAGTSSPLIGLPREESRCLLQDLPLLLEQAHLPTQPAQLLPLLARQPVALTSVDVCLTNPAPQRLAGDPELTRDPRLRLPTALHKPHRLLTELSRI